MDTYATLPREIVDIICGFNALGFKHTCKKYHQMHRMQLRIAIRDVFVKQAYWMPHPDFPWSYNHASCLTCFELDAMVSWREFRRGNGDLKRTIVAMWPHNKHKLNALYYHAHKLDYKQYAVYVEKIKLQWRYWHVGYDNIEELLRKLIYK
ncbi:hypothetical protein F-S17_0054 [Faustovirus]|nr:hypothetical protein F-S17_0054 [Faustovirus]